MRALFPLLLLAACSSAPSAPVVTQSGGLISRGEAPTNKILITRGTDSVLNQRLSQPVLFLEAREIGRCRAGEPVLIRVPDGTWSITALTPGGEVTREVAVSGFQEVALVCGVTGTQDLAPILIPEPR